MGDQGHAQHTFSFLADFIDRFNDLYATTFAATACMDLRFDNPNRATQFFRSLHRFIDAKRGFPLRNGHAIFREHRLGLIFMDIHGQSTGWIDANLRRKW